MAQNWFSLRQGAGAGRQVLVGAAAAGVIDPTVSVVEFESTGADVLSVADGTVDGHEITVIHEVDGGSGIITPANLLGGTTITLLAVGDTATIKWNDTIGSYVLKAVGGATLPVMA